MNTNRKYALVIFVALMGFLTFFSYARFKGRELEIEQLRRDNEILRQYIITLEEKVTLLDSYPYEHSEIKTNNNDRVTNFPEHNDSGNCTEHRQCSGTCSNGKGATKKATKESSNIRDSRSVPF